MFWIESAVKLSQSLESPGFYIGYLSELHLITTESFYKKKDKWYTFSITLRDDNNNG